MKKKKVMPRHKKICFIQKRIKNKLIETIVRKPRNWSYQTRTLTYQHKNNESSRRKEETERERKNTWGNNDKKFTNLMKDVNIHIQRNLINPTEDRFKGTDSATYYNQSVESTLNLNGSKKQVVQHIKGILNNINR